MNTPAIRLKPGKDKSVRRFHPWIFSGAIDKIPAKTGDGDVVEVYDYKKNFLCVGHYQNSSISVRVLSHKRVPIDQSFWNSKIEAAAKARKARNLPSADTDCYRLVHGEGDGLPGLIIDIYGHTAVIQPHSAGMELQVQAIAEAVEHALGDTIEHVYMRTGMKIKEGETDPSGFLKGGVSEPVQVKENGLRFGVDVVEGQKTGFYVDQRKNRARLTDYVSGKTVLNLFCYTGGFSMYAIRAGAKMVHSVDASVKAIEQVKKNISANGFDPEVHPAFAEEAFSFLAKKAADYDVMVLDPPAFAKHMSARHQALKGYRRLNTQAMKAIKSGGIIFTFSCSQVIDRQLFQDAILASAIQAGRGVKILDRLTQPADHPVSIYHPEGEYLKGLVLEII